MGIGVSYTGANGGNKTFDLDGVPEAGTAASGILGMSAMSTQGVFNIGLNAPLIEAPRALPRHSEMPSMADNLEDGKVSVNFGDTPGYLSEKLKPDGGLEVVGVQVGVKGFDRGSSSGEIYGNAGGEIGFHTIGRIDAEAAETHDILRNVEVELDPPNRSPKQKIIVKSTTDAYQRSTNGRIMSVRKGKPSKIFDMSVPYSSYGIKFGFEYDSSDSRKLHPIGITWIAVGDEFSLSTYDREETVNGVKYGHFKANDEQDSDSGKSNDAPVKVFSADILSAAASFCVKPTFDNNNILSSLIFGSGKQLDALDSTASSKSAADAAYEAAAAAAAAEPWNIDKQAAAQRALAKKNAAGNAVTDAEGAVKTVKTQIGCPYNS